MMYNLSKNFVLVLFTIINIIHALELDMRDFRLLANAANLCDCTTMQLQHSLMASISDEFILNKIIQREPSGLKYNIIEIMKKKTRESIRILSIRGTKNIENIKDIVLYNQPITDKNLKISMHSGIYKIYTAIFNDILSIDNNFFTSSDYKLYLTGHSLGGLASILISALAISSFENINIKIISTFGAPNIFTNNTGAKIINEKLNSIKVITCENTLDPICQYIPEYTFDNTYTSLELNNDVSCYILIEPSEFNNKYLSDLIIYQDDKITVYHSNTVIKRKPLNYIMKYNLRYHSMNNYLEAIKIISNK